MSYHCSACRQPYGGSLGGMCATCRRKASCPSCGSMRPLHHGVCVHCQHEPSVFAPDTVCRDRDVDCGEVEGQKGQFTRCWLHDPTRGWCPHLLAQTRETLSRSS